ncbi:flagellar hook-basal body complex protein FliE [Mangrovibacter phragmitis]|uniref:Flagellar hook-basal body complex protein FliE n=1 Tax=Mangrovibacter phragmitis TaxID=1691903 RepID=A0A1B7L3K8_9ENTR|nr:flagellar hook-basal body complex protein FliE [Mangrovibacter phragmitis]OAT76910.1 flagellar hook-basal body complex protein FliE [Mangrovibacter phragmitis]
MAQPISGVSLADEQRALVQALAQTAATASAGITRAAQPATQAGQPSFTALMNNAVNSVNQLQHSAATQQHAVATGQSDDLAGAMVESQKASIAFSAMTQVRNKLTRALDDIMNTPL